MSLWIPVRDGDTRALWLYRRHYSCKPYKDGRRAPGAYTHPQGADAVQWCAVGAAWKLAGRPQSHALNSAYWHLHHTTMSHDNDQYGLPVVRRRLLELAAHLAKGRTVTAEGHA